MATQSTPTTSLQLPDGVWTVDSSASELGFSARGMFGLVPAKGTFGRFDGELRVAGGKASGMLRIVAESLDTGNAKRDSHLRSADFFDVEHNPTVTFTLLDVRPVDGAAAQLTGDLQIRQNRLQITAPLEIARAGDQLRLTTSLSVDRAAPASPGASSG